MATAELIMFAHLHLHLEPEIRQRRHLGLAYAVSDSPAAFFGAHELNRTDRPTVDQADLVSFLTELHEEQHRAGVDYVELRLSPQRFLADGLSLAEFLRVTHATLGRLVQPMIRAILLINRNSSTELLEAIQQVIEQGLPSCYVGIDLAGDEIRYPETVRFISLFTAARRAGLGVTVHAGEFGGAPDGIWRALDELGASRIGHGLAAVGSPHLLRRLADDAVMVEVSVSSNIQLGAIVSIDRHPLRTLIECGVPVCFNTDVPLHTGRDWDDEFALVATILSVDADEVRQLQAQAMSFTFL